MKIRFDNIRPLTLEQQAAAIYRWCGVEVPKTPKKPKTLRKKSTHCHKGHPNIPENRNKHGDCELCRKDRYALSKAHLHAIRAKRDI